MNIKNDKLKKLIVLNLLLDCKTIKNYPLAYETYGKLNEKDNAILIFHALTGDQFASELIL